MSLGKHRKQIEKFDFFLKKINIDTKFPLAFWFPNHKWPFYCVSTVFHYVCRITSGDGRKIRLQDALESAFEEMRPHIRSNSLCSRSGRIRTVRMLRQLSSIECFYSNAIQQYGTPNGLSSANCFENSAIRMNFSI